MFTIKVLFSILNLLKTVLKACPSSYYQQTNTHNAICSSLFPVSQSLRVIYTPVCHCKLFAGFFGESLGPVTVFHITPALHDMSIKSKGSLLCAVVGGPHRTSQTTLFHFCFSGEVRRHMTWASWHELLCLFKVQSTCCRLVRGGQFCRKVHCAVGTSHVFTGLCLSFLLTWERWQTAHSVWITQHRWQRPLRAWKLPDGSHTSAGKNMRT